MFAERDGRWWVEDLPLADLASRCGTPTFVYSAAGIRARLAALEAALAGVPHRIHFAVKTNSNLGILGTLARAGAGFDIVSGGELYRLQRIGVPADRIVFAGAGKTRAELEAAVGAGIRMFHVESKREAELLSEIALGRDRTAAVALRINPDVAAGGHGYVATGTSAAKFGIPRGEAVEAFRFVNRLPGLRVRGLHCHVGSQILDPGVFRRAAEVARDLVLEVRTAGMALDEVNLGGGLGIPYLDERPPSVWDWVAALWEPLHDLGVCLVVEPGRSLVGEAGVLLTRVLYRKATGGKTFVVVDAAMNDLVRPSLYGAEHRIEPVVADPARDREVADVVGPVCETGDFLARDRALPRLEEGDLVAVFGAGAYGFVMSSNYNSRPRAAEILVDGDRYAVVREREGLEDLLRGERDWEAGAGSS